jgi:hypothetical protein
VKIIRRLRSYSSRARTWRIKSRSRAILCTIVPKTALRIQDRLARGGSRSVRDRARARGNPARVHAGPTERRLQPTSVRLAQIHEVGVLLREKVGNNELSRSIADPDCRRWRLLAADFRAGAHATRINYTCVIRKHLVILGSASVT